MTTKQGKPFYRGKSTSGAKLFMSDCQVDVARQAESIFIDGTFRQLIAKSSNILLSVEIKFTQADCDCEQGFINAIRRVFPWVQVRLCRFHVVDAIRRNADGKGLRSVKNRRADFKRFYTRIRQVFFFPTELWPRLWKIMYNELGDETKEIPGVQPFADYVVS